MALKKAASSKTKGTKNLKKTTPKTKASGKTIVEKAPPAGAKKKKLSQREDKMLAIKNRLSRQKDALLVEAECAINVLPDQTTFPDLGDQAAVETDRSFMLKLRGREQRLLKKIEEALDRIEKNVYGICEICGQEIELKRLEARPVTTMCIDCKTEQEEEEKLTGA